MRATAKRVKEIREGLKLTQSAFAELIGVTERSIRRWENDEHKPHPLILEKMEHYARNGAKA